MDTHPRPTELTDRPHHSSTPSPVRGATESRATTATIQPPPIERDSQRATARPTPHERATSTTCAASTATSTHCSLPQVVSAPALPQRVSRLRSAAVSCSCGGRQPPQSPSLPLRLGGTYLDQPLARLPLRPLLLDLDPVLARHPRALDTPPDRISLPLRVFHHNRHRTRREIVRNPLAHSDSRHPDHPRPSIPRSVAVPTPATDRPPPALTESPTPPSRPNYTRHHTHTTTHRTHPYLLLLHHAHLHPHHPTPLISTNRPLASRGRTGTIA